MTLNMVSGPYAIMGVEWDMIHGTKFLVHLVLKIPELCKKRM